MEVLSSSFFVVLFRPLVAKCRTTAALLPVFWGVRPVAVASRGTWTMLLFLTFLMWVASCTQEAEAVVWAHFLLGCLPFRTPVPTGRPDFTLCLCQRLICVWTVETTGFSCDEALCLKCILTHHLFFCVLVILISEGVFVPLTLIICMLFHIKRNVCLFLICLWVESRSEELVSIVSWLNLPVVRISGLSWSLLQPLFALTVFYLSQQVEDKDYLEKVSGLRHQILVIQDECDVFLKDLFLFLPQGSRAASALTAGTLTSLGGTSSRRGSGETAITVDAESSVREIKVTLKRRSFLWTERTFGLWFYRLDKIKVKSQIMLTNANILLQPWINWELINWWWIDDHFIHNHVASLRIYNILNVISEQNFCSNFSSQ